MNAVVASRTWIPYAGLLVLFWGVWGAFSSLPTDLYGYPEGMVYTLWALTMIIPAAVALRRGHFDRRPAATLWGLLAGLTGAGGQILLFRALVQGPAYLVFPIVSLSPVITVLMAVVILRERLRILAAVGVVLAVVAIVLLSLTSGSEGSGGPWLPLAIVICIAWGAQAFFMRKAATVGVDSATTFSWMTISALVLIPVALVTGGGLDLTAPWQAPALAAGTQLLNAVGALFLVMALARGPASIVSPVTNALAPVLTVVVSLVFLATVPSVAAVVGIVLALVGSTLMVYSDESHDDEGPTAEVGDRDHPSSDIAVDGRT